MRRIFLRAMLASYAGCGVARGSALSVRPHRGAVAAGSSPRGAALPTNAHHIYSTRVAVRFTAGTGVRLASRGPRGLAALGTPVARVRRHGTTSPAYSGGGGGSGGSGGSGTTPREKWTEVCRRVEQELPSERRVLRRVARWVGDNPVSALISGVATASTAGAIASALALKVLFSGLSILLPAVLFATVGASTFLFFFPLLLFGFIIPSAAGPAGGYWELATSPARSLIPVS